MGFSLTGRRRLVVDAVTEPWAGTVDIDERYRPLVERLERLASERPRAYRTRVLLGAALGYGFIILMALLLIGLCAGIIAVIVANGRINFLAIKLLLVFGAIAWAMLASLWVRSDPPEGRRVTRDEVPALFDLIDDLRAKIGGPLIHEVLITSDLNAALAQIPRLGFFGWYRNYLLLGLPLLQGLTDEEVAAVIAHELGHSAGEHGRLSSKIYRTRMSWAQLSLRLQEGHWANLLQRFFRWYGPWFNAYSFVLARSNEYDADAAAAAATRPQAIGNALMRLTVQSDRHDGHWRGYYEEACRSPQPARLPYASSAAMFLAPPRDDEARRSLGEAMSSQTSLDDTHPGLADRLAALGVDTAMPPPLDRPASASLLGSAADKLAAEFDEQWWQEAQEVWQDIGREHAEAVAELASLDAAASSEPLDRERQLQRAELIASLRSEAEALDLYRAMLAADPSDQDAAFFAGAMLLGKDDPEGVELLERLAETNPLLASPCYAELAGYYRRSGDAEASDRCFAKLAEAAAHEEMADAEFREIDHRTLISPPFQSGSELDDLRSEIERLGIVKRVYLGSRFLEQGQDHQQILLFEPKRGADPQTVLDEIGSLLVGHGSFIGFSLTSETRWLLKKMKRVEGTRIYPA